MKSPRLAEDFWGKGRTDMKKPPTGGAIGRWCASWWFFGLGEALYGSGLVGPLELIAELLGYMVKPAGYYQ